MDKIKQNIDLQEAIQRYNIEKSVVGTLAYNIDQNIQKGMSVDEAIENVLQKSKSMPIGTIHNGYKKIADGKWRKVSEHGMTKEEHENKAQEHRLNMETANKENKGHVYHKEMSHRDTNKEIARKLDSKDYSDEEVTGGEKKEIKVGQTFHSPAPEGGEAIDFKITSISGDKYTIETYNDEGRKNTHVFDEKTVRELISESKEKTQKSFSESTLSKSEQKEKILKTMNDFKKGILKSQFGDIITDPNMALEIALNEIQKGGEGSRGGKVIGHTKSGKPIYESGNLHDYNFDRKEHDEAAAHHRKKARELYEQAGKIGSYTKKNELHKQAKHHSEQSDLHSQYNVQKEVEHDHGIKVGHEVQHEGRTKKSYRCSGNVLHFGNNDSAHISKVYRKDGSSYV